MKNNEITKIENYFEFFLIIFLILVFLYLIKGYLITILFASTLVFLTYNYYERVLKLIKNENISAFLILFIVLTIIILPMYLISVELINQSSNLISNGNEVINNFNLNFCNYEICRTIEQNLYGLNFNVNSLFLKFGNYFISSASELLNSITNIVVNFFIFILAFFFLLKDGDKLERYIRRLIPMKSEYKTALFIKFKSVSSIIFLNTILIAFIQGALVGLGLFFSGINSWLFWGVVAAFFAILPLFGAALVWMPVAIYLFFMKSYYIGLFLFVYGIIIVSFSDNFLRAEILKSKIDIHPFLIFISIIGGIETFGFSGIFIGPIIISLLISVIQLYNLDFK